MEKQGRPETMSDMDWLVALEEIRQLRARRDRYVDAHDWDAYEALHAPDHVSDHRGGLDGVASAWTSAAEMIENLRSNRVMNEGVTVHHSYDPEIIFETPTKARGIWAMSGGRI